MDIRTHRIKAGLTQSQLAQCLSVSQPTIAGWESGCAYPRTELLPAIAKALHCTIDELFQPAEKGGE